MNQIFRSMKYLILIIVAVFVLSCDDSKEVKEPEFIIKGCGEEQTEQINNAVSQVCDKGLKQLLKNGTHNSAQKQILRKICSLSVSLTVVCKDCTEEDPNPCAYSQPDLPLLQSEKSITVKKYLNELQKKGGITITICRNEDGTIPSANCINSIHKTRDLRTIILHEINHYVLNDPDFRHRSSTWTDVEEVDWNAEDEK